LGASLRTIAGSVSWNGDGGEQETKNRKGGCTVDGPAVVRWEDVISLGLTAWVIAAWCAANLLDGGDYLGGLSLSRSQNCERCIHECVCHDSGERVSCTSDEVSGHGTRFVLVVCATRSGLPALKPFGLRAPAGRYSIVEDRARRPADGRRTSGAESFRLWSRDATAKPANRLAAMK
jgi:hypothetical protein